jgi:hypothetical protein
MIMLLPILPAFARTILTPALRLPHSLNDGLMLKFTPGGSVLTESSIFHRSTVEIGRISGFGWGDVIRIIELCQDFNVRAGFFIQLLTSLIMI